MKYLLMLLCLLPAGALAQEVVTSGLEHPWAIEFIDNENILVTERPGRMRIIKNGVVGTPLAGVPEVVAKGQGGLLDVALHQGRVYFTYAEPQPEGAAALALARAKLTDTALEQVEVIWRQSPIVKGRNHFGSRIAFGADGWLYLGVGDRWDYKELAQDLASTMGKVMRMQPDGSQAEVYSYGHRNIQAMAFDPEGTLWVAEHGARGGDEMNRIEQGKNYGWPEITYSRDYLTRLPIGEGTERPDVVAPVRQWTPAIAPSGLEVYQGQLYVGSLVQRQIFRLGVAGEESTPVLPQGFNQRVRDLKTSPTGRLYFITDEATGQLLRLH